MAGDDNRAQGADFALSTQRALDNVVALEPEAGAPVEIDLKLDVVFSGSKRTIEFPRNVKEVHRLVRSLYLALGEDAVRAVFFALRERVRTFEFASRNARNVNEVYEHYRKKFGNDHIIGIGRFEGRGGYEARMRRRMLLGQELIRQFIAAWNQIVDQEGQFLQWYERTCFSAAQALFRDKRAILDYLWHDLYRIYARGDADKKVVPIQAVLSGDVDIGDLTFNPEDENRKALMRTTKDLAALWHDYLARIKSLNDLKSVPVPPKDLATSIASDEKGIKAAHEKYRDAARVFDDSQSIAISACKKFEAAFLTKVSGLPSETKRDLDLEVFLLESMTEAYLASMSVEKRMAEFLVFPSDGTKLSFEPPDEDYFLRPSTAKLIAMQLEDWGFFKNNVAVDALWTQKPILTRIDMDAVELISAHARRAGLAASPEASGVKGSKKEGAYFREFLTRLGEDRLMMLGASTAAGTVSYRARSEVDRCIELETSKSNETYANAKKAIALGGMALAWSTGGASLLVAGALDGAFSIVDSGTKFSDYVSRKDQASIVLSEVEDAFWHAPHLCDLVQDVTTTLFNVLGNVVTEGVPSHVIDALAMTLSLMEDGSK